ncbi:ATP-binding protein [uncultured Ferrovibrio sp.]|jgi:two-component system cell cycle sensor histidine kinase/response regulator CckA|uniref:PAS domain-containing hybrid sensor histidine kinase/response regulator n=1 Tax=uncultured Ferrovibrio sp. TaxID=1576913 RepID=UPI002624EE75|nr:ATP-binding protein [uncultured Ferrovibrio sp.]
MARPFGGLFGGFLKWPAKLVAEASPFARVVMNGPAVAAANAGYRNLAARLQIEGAPTIDRLVVSRLGNIETIARMRGLAAAGETVQEDLEVAAGDQILTLRISAMARPDWRHWMVWDVQCLSDQDDSLIAMRRQRDELAAFIDNAPVGLYSVGLDGRFLFANRTFAAWLNTVPEQLVGRNVTLADVLQHAEAREGEVMTPNWEGGEAKLKPLDADTNAESGFRLVGVSQSAVTDGDGRPVRYSAVVHDLSLELRHRGTLRPVEAEFRRFFDQAPIGILVLDSTGVIRDANAAFAALTGREDGLGQRLADLVREEDALVLTRHLMALRRGETFGRPLEIHLAGPRARVVEVFAASSAERDDGQSAQLVYLVDTTEQRNLQTQFHQSQKMQAVGQLAGGIAHDFNNLLTAMIGFCDLLLQRHQPGDQSFADVMQIKQNASRAANLVRQLLAFSRQQTLVPKILDITDVLADLRNLISRLIGETITLKMTHGRDLGLVRVDQGQLEQVIINLAVNARDAMTEGGELRIRTSNWQAERPTEIGAETIPPGEYVLIEVADNGHGIAPENLSKIFDPFFTTKAVGAGTGLGLSTVYGIIKQTGGFIQVESAEGEGACFRIYLPRYRPTPEELAAVRDDVRHDSRDLTGRGLVLLVEDEDAVRSFAARALRNKGYTVIEAASGEQALALPAEQLERVELLISDVVMPNLDGPSLAAELRLRRPNLRVLFISGYAEDSLRTSLAKSPHVNFLPKPFSLSQLAGKVKEVMGP